MKTMQCRMCGCTVNAEAPRCEVCGADNCTELDTLTDKLTAFRTFAAFCTAMKTGYVPSIYAKDNLGRMRPAYVALIAAVRAAGFRVYDGEQVA